MTERTDRELLELAARAAGEWPEYWHDSEAYFTGVLSRWNPLEDDGDAFRLSIKLGLRVQYCDVSCYAAGNGHVAVVTVQPGGMRNRFVGDVEEWASDPYSATRRAIVRAASQISLGMENHNGMA
tara:strand:+ start:39458 stop:39832 length:375 start_codon:yes stop_codon:yes gene_type:complete